MTDNTRQQIPIPTIPDLLPAVRILLSPARLPNGQMVGTFALQRPGSIMQATLTADELDNLADNLKHVATQVRSGLVLASSIPNSNPQGEVFDINKLRQGGGK